MNDLEKIKIIKDFVKRTYLELGIKKAPEIIITNDRKWCQAHTSFGSYEPSTSRITVYLGKRNLADFLRTLGHELVHHYQNENDLLYQDAGETGSDIENEANSKAGVMLRNYGKMNNSIYENKQSEKKTLKRNIVRHDEDNSLVSVEYKFDIDNTTYRVEFNSEIEGSFDVSFGIHKGDFNQIDTFQMTGKGNAKTILKKVAETIDTFVEEFENEIESINISGTSEKRDNLYKKYIEQFVNKNSLEKIKL